MNETTVRIKKCPCCGGKAKLDSSAFSGTIHIHCTKCGLGTRAFMSVKKAIESWNRRVHVE